MNYSDYQSEALKQLCDHTFYRFLEEDPTQSFLNKTRTYLQPHGPNEGLSRSTVTTLCPDNFKTLKIYLIPKTHISGNPSRPIVSSIVTPSKESPLP